MDAHKATCGAIDEFRKTAVAVSRSIHDHPEPKFERTLRRRAAFQGRIGAGTARGKRNRGSEDRFSRRIRLSRLALTAPSIVEAICRGRQPAELNAETLLNRIDLPLEWPPQLKAIGID